VKRSLEIAVCTSERLSASNSIASSVRQTSLWDDLMRAINRSISRMGQPLVRAALVRR